MSRPTSKDELLSAASAEFAKLWGLLGKLPEAMREDVSWQAPIEDRSRNPRDVLGHLHQWHLLMLGWHEVAEAGGRPQIPAPGFTWRTTPALNDQLWERESATSYVDAERKVKRSHDQVMAVIESHSNEELFTKKHYPWTGSTSLGAFLVSATSSHYVWGQKTLRAIKKAAI